MVNYGTINGSVTATGANNALSLNCTGYGTCGIDVRGTFTATLVPEGTIDNATWFTLTITPVAGGAGVTTITAAGAWTVPTAGFSAIRLRSSAYTSGTPTIVLAGTIASTLNTNVSVTADTEFPAAAALADALSATPTTTQVGSIPLLMNATTLDRQRAVIDTLDSTGTGIAAAGIVGQYDDTTPTAVTENKFAPIRISSRRALLVEGVASGTAIAVLDTNSAAALTALQLIDDTVYTDDTSTHATGTSKGLGIMAAATPTDGSIDANDIGMVAMTTDRRLHTQATNNGTFVVQENGAALTALQLIDNAVSGAGFNITQVNGEAIDVGAGTEAAAIRVTLPTDGTGVVGITGAALTALQLIDDAIYVDDAAFTPTTSKLIAIGCQADETASDSVDEGDIGTPRMTLDRRIRIASKATDGPGEPTIDSYTHASINLAAAADQVLVSSAANKQIWVYGIGFTVNAAGTVSFQDEDNVAITGIMPFAANGGMTVAPSGNFAMPIWKLGTDKDLEVDIVTSELDGWVDYAIVSV